MRRQSGIGLDGPKRQGDTTMLTKSEIALSLAIILGTASAATAATKQPIHHHQGTVAQRHLRAAPGSSAYGFAAPIRVQQPNSGNGIGTNFLSSGEGTIAN
jgi:hypothetical protein